MGEPLSLGEQPLLLAQLLGTLGHLGFDPLVVEPQLLVEHLELFALRFELLLLTLEFLGLRGQLLVERLKLLGVRHGVLALDPQADRFLAQPRGDLEGAFLDVPVVRVEGVEHGHDPVDVLREVFEEAQHGPALGGVDEHEIARIDLLGGKLRVLAGLPFDEAFGCHFDTLAIGQGLQELVHAGTREGQERFVLEVREKGKQPNPVLSVQA